MIISCNNILSTKLNNQDYSTCKSSVSRKKSKKKKKKWFGYIKEKSYVTVK